MSTSQENNFPAPQFTQQLDKIMLVVIIMLLATQVALSFVLIYRIHNIEIMTTKTVQNKPSTLLEDSIEFFENVSPGNSPSIGPVSAPITIIEFGDYQCPYCAQEEQVLRTLLGNHSSQIRLIYRNYPLQIHKDAMNASLAALCANEQNQFWEMHNLLFMGQDNLDLKSIEGMASSINLDIDSFKECLASNRYNNEIEKDILDALEYGVEGTPTFFVNGYRLEGAIDLKSWEKIINEVSSKK